MIFLQSSCHLRRLLLSVSFRTLKTCFRILLATSFTNCASRIEYVHVCNDYYYSNFSSLGGCGAGRGGAGVEEAVRDHHHPPLGISSFRTTNSYVSLRKHFLLTYLCTLSRWDLLFLHLRFFGACHHHSASTVRERCARSGFVVLLLVLRRVIMVIYAAD